MICYTRNFEDVVLQRVLRDVENGCFLDVGACMPEHDSNTFALYEKGWRGICVDPMEYKDDWAQARPQDIFINAAVGKESGRTDFYVFDEFGQISTGSKDAVEHWRTGNLAPNRKIEVPVYTLDQLLEQHLAGRALHLVSIDVEGMEKEVLQGFDLRKHRPWVVVVEAMKPGTQVPTHEEWEPLITGAGYSMVYCDGVNRFYLSDEKADLLERFRFPPNIFDGFEQAATIELKRKYDLLESENERLAAELSQCRKTGLPKAPSKRKFSITRFFTGLKF